MHVLTRPGARGSPPGALTLPSGRGKGALHLGPPNHSLATWSSHPYPGLPAGVCREGGHGLSAAGLTPEAGRDSSERALGELPLPRFAVSGSPTPSCRPFSSAQMLVAVMLCFRSFQAPAKLTAFDLAGKDNSAPARQPPYISGKAETAGMPSFFCTMS